MAKTRRNLEKKLFALYDIYEKCQTRKCSSYVKKRRQEGNLLIKETDKTCRQKTAKARVNCSDKLALASGFSKSVKDLDKCSKKKCHKEISNVARSFKRYRV